MRVTGLFPRGVSAAVRLLLVGLTSLILILAVPSAWAQTGVGSVSGTVRDDGEAAVPGAKVTITNTETGLARNAQSSPDGSYYFGDLPRGPYNLTVEFQGFETWTGTLILYVGQNVVVNPALRPGNVKTVVKVTGAAPTITTTGAT